MPDPILLLPPQVTPSVPTTPARDLPIQTWSEWQDVNLVRSAMRALEVGYFDAATQVIDAMGRDDRINGVLGTRTGALPSLPMTFTPALKADGRRKKVISDQVEEMFPEMFPDYALTELALWGLMAGIGVGQLIWRFEDTIWVPTLKVWHPRFLNWRWDTRSYWMGTMDGMRELIPGNGEWILYAPWGLQRAWMYGKVRSLFVPWLIRQFGLRDWARYSEVHGLPIKKAVTPAGAESDDKNRFLKEVANLGKENLIVTPRTSPANEYDRYDIELVEAVGRSTEAFEHLVEMANSCVSINLLGQNLTTEVKGGSFAATMGHMQIRNDLLTGDAENLGRCIQQQGLEPFTQINFGDKRLAPLPQWKTKPADDKVTSGTAIKNLGDGLLAIKKIGAKPDVDKLMANFEIPITGPAEDVDVNALPQPAQAPGQGEDDEKEPGKLPRPKKQKVTASRTKDGLPEAMIEGQMYADEVAESGAEDGAAIFKPDLRAILELIGEADSLKELQKSLRKKYASMSRDRLAKLMKTAIQLSELSGRYAVQQETKED